MFKNTVVIETKNKKIVLEKLFLCGRGLSVSAFLFKSYFELTNMPCCQLDEV